MPLGPFHIQWLTEIMVQVSNHIYCFVLYVIIHTCPKWTSNLAKPPAWINNYIPPIYVDVIIYPCFKHELMVA